MLHIVTDSSAMLSQNEAQIDNYHVAPLHILYGGKSYLDGKEINAQEILEVCQNGIIPTTSQPSIGEKIDLYDFILEDPKATILDLTIADGLSGTYQTALMAKDACIDPKRVTVYNTHTLAGPHRHLIHLANALRAEGKSGEEIASLLQSHSNRDVSMVAASDCAYLVNSGRVSSFVGTAGAMMRLVPIVGTAENGSKLNFLKASRTMKKAIQFMVENLAKKGVDSSYHIYISHAGVEKLGNYAKEVAQNRFPQAKVSVEPLCALFTVHGGPGAIAIQAIPA